MTAEYVAEVYRFGGPSPYKDQYGHRRNLSHGTDFARDEVVTNDKGDVIAMPLLVKKPCFGRPERYLRAVAGSKPWTDKNGETKPGSTPCDTCFEKSAGVYEACLELSLERVASQPRIQAAFDEWNEASRGVLGRKAFHGRLGQLWQNLLDEIVAAGGWSNVNDDHVRVHRHAEAAQKRQAAANRRKARRKEARDARKGRSKPITPEFLRGLEQERDRRVEHLKALRDLPVASGRAMRWLGRMSDTTCERIGDVWRERELLARAGKEPKQRTLVDQMWAAGKKHGASSKSVLAARVSEDIKKRLAKLEDDSAGAPIWPRWTFSGPYEPNDTL